VLGLLLFSNDIVAQIDICRFYMYADDVQLYLSDDPCSRDDFIRRINADLDRLYIWATETGLCLNLEISQAIVIGFPRFRAAAVQPVSMRSATIPFCTRVKMSLWDRPLTADLLGMTRLISSAAGFISR
jgi:hypothetical protein